MKLRIDDDKVVCVLSRRNLVSLLAKLDGHPPMSYCTLRKVDDEGGKLLVVAAEEDELHYSGRGYPPGLMHPDTEETIS